MTGKSQERYPIGPGEKSARQFETALYLNARRRNYKYVVPALSVSRDPGYPEIEDQILDMERLLADHLYSPKIGALKGDESILEVGCGAGNFLRYLKHVRGHEGSQLTGIDINPVLFADSQLRDPDINFFQADAEDLHQIPDGSLDVFIAAYMLYHAEDAEKVIEQGFLKLKPGGLFVSEHRGPNNMRRVWEFQPRVASALQSLRPELYTGVKAPPSFYWDFDIPRTHRAIKNRGQIIDHFSHSSVNGYRFEFRATDESDPVWLDFRDAVISPKDNYVIPDPETGEYRQQAPQIGDLHRAVDLAVKYPFFDEMFQKGVFEDHVEQITIIARKDKEGLVAPRRGKGLGLVSLNEQKLAYENLDKLKGVELIIFDWDDVFTVSSTLAYMRCYDEAAMAVGIRLSPEELLDRMKQNWGKRHERILLGVLGGQTDLLPQASEVYMTHLLGGTFEEFMEVIPEAASLIKRLSANHKIGISSAIHPELLKKLLANNGIDQAGISEIVTAYDEDISDDQAKPDARSARLIMSRVRIPPSKTLVVGDAANDILLGKNAGTRTVAVLSGPHLNEEQARALGPDRILNSVTEIESILEKAA